MSAEVIHREMFFRFKRTENDIARVRSIADRAEAEQRAKTDAARQRIERQLTTIISGADWYERLPADCEPFSDGRA